jgi:two-component system sensor histidine kinase/response regulator
MVDHQPVSSPIAGKGDILIVDDTLPNLRVLSSMLTEQGYEVRGAPNGPMALMIIEAEPPDLILLDINMPGMDGYEVCQKIKANPQTQDIPVIFISALDEVLDKVKAFSVGAVDYITKPFQIAEVLVSVKNHLTIRTLQQQLQQTNTELRRANHELVAANVALRETNRELDAFARTVAHDLKSPLTVMMGYADLLKNDLVDQETLNSTSLELLEQIEQGGQQGVRIIDKLLLLAWVRKGQVDLTPVDMGAVVAQVRQSLASVIQQSQAELILPEQWPAVLGYQPWLEEVWANYLSNGLKYGSRPPRLELGATPQENGLIRFWVRDNGSGLSPQDQRNLFTEFTQLEPDRADEHGLGLSIVRRIIEKLGGEVGVESEVGQGSLFYFTLPAVLAK